MSNFKKESEARLVRGYDWLRANINEKRCPECGEVIELYCDQKDLGFYSLLCAHCDAVILSYSLIYHYSPNSLFTRKRMWSYYCPIHKEVSVPVIDNGRSFILHQTYICTLCGSELELKQG